MDKKEELQESHADQTAEAPTQEPPRQPEEHPPQSQQHRRQRSVFQSIAILFAAAFVLLLLTYVMDRRQYELIQDQNQAQINDLLQSATAVQSLQNLSNENAELKDQVEDLQEQLSRLQSQLDEQSDSVSQLETALEKTSAALDWFWQIDEAYVRGRYTLCRQLIESLNEAGLVQWLPQESVTDNERFSPYDRYQEIYEALY